MFNVKRQYVLFSWTDLSLFPISCLRKSHSQAGLGGLRGQQNEVEDCFGHNCWPPPSPAPHYQWGHQEAVCGDVLGVLDSRGEPSNLFNQKHLKVFNDALAEDLKKKSIVSFPSIASISQDYPNDFGAFLKNVPVGPPGSCTGVNFATLRSLYGLLLNAGKCGEHCVWRLQRWDRWSRGRGEGGEGRHCCNPLQGLDLPVLKLMKYFRICQNQNFLL